MADGKTNRPKKEPVPTKAAVRMARAKVVVPHPYHQFGYKHHLFIAKLKAGEVWALNYLKAESKAAVTPLFEMWPPEKAKPLKPAKTLIQHASDLLKMLESEWTGLPFFLDCQYLPISGPSSPAAASTVFAVARAKGLLAVPVTSPFHPQPYQEVIRDVVAIDSRGVMIRLTTSFFNAPTLVAGYLTGLLRVLGVEPKNVDILIDLGYQTTHVGVQQGGAFCVDALPSIGTWRTVTLASGFFPESITTMPMGSWLPYSRVDWLGWIAVASQRHAAGQRVPSYGDYAVRCGGPPPEDSVPNGPAPNLRYSNTREAWARRGPKQPGVMTAMCADLVQQPFFSGAQFSEGDSQIAQRAATTNQTNASGKQWIEWCTNHHLEMCAEQIRSLP